MGVTGLWTVLSPCARPIKLETLNKKRLAVDASIWIYQFLKAVRDKEGNALRNSHVVGFFRRICKLLFFGIKPVFVFDGGAPVLKRQTISSRKARREGRRDDAVRTAGKLLAVQMQRRAEQEAQRERERDKHKGRRQIDNEEPLPNADQLVYVNEIGMTEQERKVNRGFKKKDQYHLPALEADFSAMGAPNDPRVMSQEELEEYARQFHSGEDINLYDFSKIDFDSPFFTSLPASDRYNILNAARLRSRLRMGYSKEQLDTMFPDRMAFSRFQIERVTERNELTQRLMNLNGMNGEEFNINARIAGEKGKEYVLVKNDGVEGGWVLGVVSNKEGERSRPIDVDQLASSQAKAKDDDEWEDEEAFEDIPIEGLNRLPKPPTLKTGLSSADDLERRRNLYLKRREDVGSRTQAKKPVREEPESLFVEEPSANEDKDVDALFEDVIPEEVADEDDEELQRAIAMSLENENDDQVAQNEGGFLTSPVEANASGSTQKRTTAGRAYAHFANAKAYDEIDGPFAQESDDEEDDQLLSGPRAFSKLDLPKKAVPDQSENHGFLGPLPFESLNLGVSLLGKKKQPEEQEGGFEKNSEKEPEPLPPWFSANLEQSYAAQKGIEKRDQELQKLDSKSRMHKAVPILHRQQTREVIDLDAPKRQNEEVIEVESSDKIEDNIEMLEVPIVDNKVQAHDTADLARTETPQTPKLNGAMGRGGSASCGDIQREAGSEEIEWSESDLENEEDRRKRPSAASNLIDSELEKEKSSSPEFEDIEIPGPQESPASKSASLEFEDVPLPEPTSVIADGLPRSPEEITLDSPMAEALSLQDEEGFSDSEDEELMMQMAAEAEEHARFAASLTTNAQHTSAEDYERELRQLRNQQKKDRRDADEVTQIMITECQQLLQLFGLPYITAPMEAEAQCAELVSLGLVDGIVTDDSDIFLFGGTRVYKNMFNQAKFVECYLSSDLEKEYSLTREKIIQAAHLLGSDYTEGLPTVGPVTALEILSEFPSLADFRDWWEQVQHGHFPPADNAIPFRRKFRKNATKLFLPPGFPDPRVDQAYLHPDVDSDPSDFVWGVPDLDALRSFLMATIGWGQERADEILVPVIRDMNRREVEGTQANITRFFGGSVGTGTVVQKRPTNGSSEGFAPRRRKQGSSRMQTALGKLHAAARRATIGEDEEEEATGDVGEKDKGPATVGASKKKKARRPAKRKQKKRTRVDAENDETSDSSLAEGAPEPGSDDEDSGGYAPPKKVAKRKRTAQTK